MNKNYPPSKMLVASNDNRPTMPAPKQPMSLFGQNPNQMMQSIAPVKNSALTPMVAIGQSTSSQLLAAKQASDKIAEKKAIDTSITIVPRDKKNGKHLVLDLDETLVHTFDDKDGLADFVNYLTPEQRKRIYMIEFPGGESMWGYIRPYAEEFLRVAFNEFESVGVWSAGTQYYVANIVQVVFKDQSPKFVMSRNQCNELKIKNEEVPCRYKPLEVIYSMHADHTSKNTVIVDDRHDICELNCMNNIRIPEFNMNNFNNPAMVNDITLLTLAKWFQDPQFRDAKDVREVKSRSPFKI